MHWEELGRLLWMLPLVIFWLIYYFQSRQEEVGFPMVLTATYTSMRLRFQFLSLLLLAASSLLLVFVIARPIVYEERERETRPGIAIQLVVDVSSSMSQDIMGQGEKSTRMEVAKKVIEQFVQGQGDDLIGRPNDIIGLITFARYSDILCPLTHSHKALLQITRDITINDTPNEDGTAFGDAVALAAARLSALENVRGDDFSDIQSKVIVLLTDGENNSGLLLPDQATAFAQKWGIRVYAISLADPQYTTMGLMQNSVNFLTDSIKGDEVLYKMATRTGGIFRTAHDYDTLKNVYSEIDQLEKSEISVESFRMARDASRPFALASFGCFLFSLMCYVFIFRGVREV